MKKALCCLLVCGGFADVVVADPADYSYGKMASGQSGHEEDNEDQQDYGIPVFRIDESRWFDITIDLPNHPETAQEVEEQRNRDAQLRKSGRPETSTFFPDTHEITEGIRLRFHYRFD